MASFRDVGERGMIDIIREAVRPGGDARGMRDDAALLPGGIVASTDCVTFERHMPEGMGWERFGWTAAAVNISDIASMGARPIAVLAAMALPEDMDQDDIALIASGMDQCAEFAGAHIVGGDTKPGPGMVAGTAIGDMEGRRPMTRDGMRPGDLIAVTGTLGGPAAGFLALGNGMDAPDCVFSLYVPIPRVEEGIALSSTGLVTSCMDLSDGLSTCLNTLCAESGCGAVVEWDLLPVADGVDEVCSRTCTDVRKAVMDWGGEYELLFSFAKADIEGLRASGVEFSVIGIATEEEGAMLRRDGKCERICNGSY